MKLYHPNLRKSLTVAVQHNQTRYHQHGVPVELQGRAVPGETAAPPFVPQTHAHHAGQAQAQAQQEAYVEAHDGPHLVEICRLNRREEQSQNERGGRTSVVVRQAECRVADSIPT